jgi:DNA-binding CsgD family transcriptional regulator
MRHVDAAIWRDLKANDDALRPVAVHQQGVYPLVFRAIRIQGEMQPYFSPAYALLIATDLGEVRVADPSRLRDVLNFTPAEAVLAQSLMKTLNLVKAAEALGISHETARSQLKSLFAKSGSDSQLSLMRILQALSR